MPGPYSTEQQQEPGRNRLVRHFSTVAAVVLAAAHFSSFDIFSRAIVTDIRFYLYFAARTARGAVPHLEFFDHKTQLATFVGALFYQLGDLVGGSPLIAIRVGYLSLAGVAGLLLYVLFRRLTGGSGVAGLLALLMYTAFPLLAVLPATGNIPKMLMALSATATALMVGSRRWLLAGVAAGLAIMDWQVGCLALAAALAGAISSADRRSKAVLRVLAGSLLVALPVALYYAWHGALRVALDQNLTGSLARAEASHEVFDFIGHLRNIFEVVRLGCGQQMWLVPFAGIGVVILPVWIWRLRGSPGHGTAIALAVYHFGLIAFSMYDFQRFGDLFILLHSIVFFNAVTVVEVARRLRVFEAADKRPTRGRTAIRIAYLIVVIAMARPLWLRPELVLESKTVSRETTLEDQLEVSRQLRPLVAGRKLAFVEHSEQLFLTGVTNGLSFVYWNQANAYWYRANDDEGGREALMRLVKDLDPDVIVAPPWLLGMEPLQSSFCPVVLTSASGSCSMTLHVRCKSILETN